MFATLYTYLDLCLRLFDEQYEHTPSEQELNELAEVDRRRP